MDGIRDLIVSVLDWYLREMETNANWRAEQSCRFVCASDYHIGGLHEAQGNYHLMVTSLSVSLKFQKEERLQLSLGIPCKSTYIIHHFVLFRINGNI